MYIYICRERERGGTDEGGWMPDDRRPAFADATAWQTVDPREIGGDPDGIVNNTSHRVNLLRGKLRQAGQAKE